MHTFFIILCMNNKFILAFNLYYNKILWIQ